MGRAVSKSAYKAIVSSDWSECLSPNGPFDCIAFNFPALADELNHIFRQYTGNIISLTQATRAIRERLPQSLVVEQMDAYLEASFQTYKGVAELIEWCLDYDVLFMINTTGTQGYFQRVFAKKLLPTVPIVAANPSIRFADSGTETSYANEVLEIEDKPKNTEAILRAHSLPANKVVIMGDSGGDGPHFRWGAENGAFLIGIMAKNSLVGFCESTRIRVNRFFGLSYGVDQARDLEKEMKFDFRNSLTFCKTLLNFRFGHPLWVP